MRILGIEVRMMRDGCKRGVFLALLAVFLTFISGWALLYPVSAGSIVVTTTDDEINSDGDCSLREAIIAANTDTAVSGCAGGSGADVISIPSGIYNLTVTGTGEDDAALGDLDITESVTINGAGIGITIIDGQGSDRVFDLAPVAEDAIIINEIMIDPSAVADAAGEWIELFNPGGSAVDIEGWTIQDDDLDSHIINYGSPLFVPPSGYLVLARENDPGLNGGVSVDYEYANFQLDNSEDEVILLDVAGFEVDRVDYDDVTFPDPTGASIALMSPGLDNNQGTSWCSSSTSFGDGDAGTPGARNDCSNTGISVAFADLTVQNGSGSNGAGIRNQSDLILDSVAVTNNAGIGIYHLEGGFAFTDGDIDANTGGGFSSFHSSPPRLDVYFENAGIHGNSGAGIECINTTLTVFGGEIENNGFSGVWGNGCTMEFASAFIWGNTTPGDGGGIMSANYALTLTNTTVGHNTAVGRGGGIYFWGLSGQDLQMTGGSLTDNEAQDGGGLYLDAGVATLDGVSVTTNRALESGGGVYVDVNIDAHLSLVNGTFIGNTLNGNVADSDGDYSGSGGGIYNLGALSITDSVIRNNTGAGIDSFSPTGAGPSITIEGSEIANNTGSGISAVNTVITISDCMIASNEWGGIWAMGSPLSMTECTVRENSTPGDGGGLALINVSADGVANSTIEGNSADGDAGGIYFWGLGTSGTLTLLNSTVSTNTADGFGGGIVVASGAGTEVKMSGVTLVENVADADDDGLGDGGGIDNASMATVKIKHTLIGLNRDVTSTAGTQWGQDCVGSFQSYQYNFIGRVAPVACTIFGGSNDIIGNFFSPIDPLIGPLQWNGGLTDTHALLSGSPAIGAGQPGPCTDVDGNPFTEDQRGMGRPIGMYCDIGAYEAPVWVYLPLIMR